MEGGEQAACYDPLAGFTHGLRAGRHLPKQERRRHNPKYLSVYCTQVSLLYFIEHCNVKYIYINIYVYIYLHLLYLPHCCDNLLNIVFIQEKW